MLKNRQPSQWLNIIVLIFLITSFTACGKIDLKDELRKPLQVQSESASEPYTFPISLFYQLRHSLQLAESWLLQNQNEDGSWQSDPLLTAFVLDALVEKPGDRQNLELEEPIARGFAYLKRFVKADGSFEYLGARRYLTAAALLAMAAYNQPADQTIIKRARTFLIRSLNDEEEGYSPGDKDYGGLGYGAKPADLTGTQLALEAVKAAGIVLGEEPILPAAANPDKYESKALIFITRCQSAEPATEGGFASMPVELPPAQEPKPVCGSMTYTGLKALFDAGLPQTDPRVQKTIAWIKKHYTLQADPGLNPAHLNFYFMLMAKALSLTGSHSLVDEKKQEHFWREELADRLISGQKGDGYWQDDTFASQAKSLDTVYAMLALKFLLHGLEIKAIQ